MSNISVVVQPSGITIVPLPNVGAPGPAGPPGPQGLQGPPGANGSGGDKHYAHAQGVASTVWSVAHNLGKYPSVTVVDSAGTEVEGEIRHLGTNSLQLIFSAAFSGTAYCN